MASNTVEELELIDLETNKKYTLYVNLEDARKAKNDMQFANKLLQYAKQDTLKSGKKMPDNQSTCTLQSAKGNTSQSGEEESDLQGYKQDNQSNNEDIYIWNKKETLLLICLYKENEVMFTTGKMKQHSCWEHIAKKMAEKGYNVSGKKCCTKFQTLKRTYKQIKDHNNKSGNSRKTWEYFDNMDELFSTKPWIQPIAVAGSNTNDESEEPSSQAIRRERNKENKCSSTSYKQKVFEYRKLRAEQKEKQHEEKIKLLSEIKNLIQQTIEKE